MARVSVVIPVYNIAPHLRQCLDSVADQTLKDLEIICVDDGSTDESPAILREYAQKDARFRVITQANAGPGAARNTGMDQAAGEYLIFLDSDDWFERDFLEQMTLRAEEANADVVICKAVEFDTNTAKELPSDWMLKEQYLPGEAFRPEEVSEYLFQFTYGMPWDKLYRRNWLMTTGIKYPSLKNSEDLAFVFPALLAAERIAVLRKVMIHHRVNRSASVSNSRVLQPEAPYQAFQIVKAYLEQTGKMTLYQRSFLNWAMEFLVWHISNMEDSKIRLEYFQILRRVWMPELEFERYPARYYRDKGSYAKYVLAKYAPFRVFSATVKLYKGAKRLRQGV